MSSLYFHAVGQAFKESNKMAPVKPGKNPIVAFVLGFLFGPIGVGLYLHSFPDFALTLLMVVVGAFVTVGIGAPIFWMLCGAWAAVRVHQANRA